MPTINLAAAASLVNGLPEAIAAFQFNNPTVTFTIMYGGSDALAGLIVNPNNDYFDVFLSAGQGAMNEVQNASMVDTTVSPNPVQFIGNTLVLIKNSKADPSLNGVVSFATVIDTYVGSNHIWIANPSLAPAGQYARDQFTLTSNWNYVFNKATNDNTIGSDVQITLNGLINDPKPAVDVVYNSDAKGAGIVPSAEAEQTINNTIIYPAAVLTNANDHGVKALATAFVVSLLNPTITDIFTTKGFRSLQ